MEWFYCIVYINHPLSINWLQATNWGGLEWFNSNLCAWIAPSVNIRLRGKERRCQTDTKSGTVYLCVYSRTVTPSKEFILVLMCSQLLLIYLTNHTMCSNKVARYVIIVYSTYVYWLCISVIGLVHHLGWMNLVNGMEYELEWN